MAAPSQHMQLHAGKGRSSCADSVRSIFDSHQHRDDLKNFSRGVACFGGHMFYTIAADLVIFLHFLWIAFIIVGFPIFLYLNISGWRVFHLLALVATVVMQLTRTICPLTYLEAYLKSKGEWNRVYPGQFTIDAIEKLIYVKDLTLEKIGYATIIFLALVLLTFWLKPVTFTRQTEG
jgi:hypothetical protein